MTRQRRTSAAVLVTFLVATGWSVAAAAQPMPPGAPDTRGFVERCIAKSHALFLVVSVAAGIAYLGAVGPRARGVHHAGGTDA
jgi:hypothetical protein